MASSGETIRARLRQAREEAGLSYGRMAAETGYSRGALANMEAGRRATGEADLRDYVAAYDRALRTGGLLMDYWTALQEDDQMQRRAIVAALGTLAHVGLSSRAYISEALRASLLGALGTHDWPDIAAEYGRRFLTDPPAAFQTHLAGDLLHLRGALETADAEHTRVAAARLMTLQAMGTANLGDSRGAVRWYRAARAAADSTTDIRLRAWVRAREAFRRGYEGAAPAEVLAVACDVAGEVEAHLAVAQAHARLGDRAAALRTLEEARRAHERADHSEATIYAMPPWRMAVSAAYVYALLGMPDACTAELAAGPAPTMARWAVQYKMQQAVALTRGGDTVQGGQLAREVMRTVPDGQRSIVITQMWYEATGREPVAAAGSAGAG